MKNNKKFTLKKTMSVMAGLGMVYANAVSAGSVDGVTCTIGESSVWNNGFTFDDIEVTNNSGSSIDEWEVLIKLGTSDAVLVSNWDGLVSIDENIATVTNEAYNGSLADGASTTFGFSASHNSDEVGEATCIVATKGINSSTGYAENYEVTGDEMTLDFSNVDWNVVNVTTASELKSAFKNATAGDKIVIASGTYVGNFKLEAGGSQDAPIWIVGEDADDMPILDGDDYNNSYALTLDGEDLGGIGYIYIQDIKATNGRGGIFVDQSDYVTIDNVEVYNIGQAGIHLRDGSEHSIVKNSYIHDTGLYNVKYGEGIYIGSDYTKWPGTGGSEYDPAVDYAQILNNTIGPNVSAEHIDIKEGSSYAYVINNTFDAAGMTDILNGGLSFIDFKGNHAEAAYNVGTQNDNEYFENAFEINEKSPGWGAYNDIHDNTVTFNDEYYYKGKVDVTLDIPLGSDGIVTTTDDISPYHWVVKNKVDSTNTVSNNIRTPEDEDKMYTGDVTEY